MALLNFSLSDNAAVEPTEICEGSVGSNGNGKLHSCLKRTDNSKSIRSWVSMSPPPMRRRVHFGTSSVKLITPLFGEDLWVKSTRAERNSTETRALQTNLLALRYICAYSDVLVAFFGESKPAVSSRLKKCLVQGAKHGWRTLERHSPYHIHRKLQAYKYVHQILLLYKQTRGQKGFETKIRKKSLKLTHTERNFALFMGGIDEAAARDHEPVPPAPARLVSPLAPSSTAINSPYTNSISSSKPVVKSPEILLLPEKKTTRTSSAVVISPANAVAQADGLLTVTKKAAPSPRVMLWQSFKNVAHRVVRSSKHKSRNACTAWTRLWQRSQQKQKESKKQKERHLPPYRKEQSNLMV